MSGEQLRIDRWLWCARLYKSRSLAAEGVKAGHVRLNGQRIKPAREVKPGDRLIIAKGPMELEVNVIAIPSRRGPAPEAAAFYSETPESVERREERHAARASQRMAQAPTSGRPDKKTRRLIRDRLKNLFGRG